MFITYKEKAGIEKTGDVHVFARKLPSLKGATCELLKKYYDIEISERRLDMPMLLIRPKGRGTSSSWCYEVVKRL